jgi:hypothetical protein
VFSWARRGGRGRGRRAQRIALVGPVALGREVTPPQRALREATEATDRLAQRLRTPPPQTRTLVTCTTMGETAHMIRYRTRVQNAWVLHMITCQATHLPQ